MNSKALKKFAKRLLSYGWLPFNLRNRIIISASKILKIVHTRSRSVEYHGLIQVLPAGKVESVIQRLNHATINGQQLRAHTYNKRLIRSDRRGVFFSEANTQPYERRQHERRRSHLVSQV
ncbi:MAG: hypothetical protein PVI92_00500, partial [Chromatiales bacterium]